MIKAEVVFDGDSIEINGKKFSVVAEYGYSIIIDNEIGIDDYSTIEQAIASCLENS